MTIKKLNRRRFLTTVAAGAGVFPLVSLGRKLYAGKAADASALCTTGGAGNGATSVLAPSDFTYLGKFKMPGNPLSEHALANGVYTSNQIAGRVVGGTTTLVMAASNCAPGGSNGLGLVELSIPADGSLTSDIASAPHCDEVRRWGPATQYGSIFAGAVHVPNELPNPDNGYPIVLGLGYDGTHLHTVFGSNYGYIGEFPNYLKTLLRDDGTYIHYGPWGTGDVPKFVGNPMQMPASVIAATGCGTFGLCSAVNGSQASSPRGSNWVTFTPPPVTTAADPMDRSRWSISKRAAILHDQGHPQARNTNAWNCAAVVPNQLYDDNIGGFPGGTIGPVQFQPYFGGLNGADAVLSGQTTLDWVDSGVWIEGPNKHGVLFLAQLVETIKIANGFSQDKTYGGWKWTGSTPTHDSTHHFDPDHAHAIYGSSICGHGHFMPLSKATGPSADSMANYGFIYDPADLVAILKGASVYGATPAHSFHLNALGAGLPEERNVFSENAGIWYDATNKRLYITQANAYSSGYDVLPVVHVLAVNC